MEVREIIKQLADCDPYDDVYINIEIDGVSNYYSIDGLENKSLEYRKNPTFATLKIKG